MEDSQNGWLKYSNQGATRNKPIQSGLVAAMSFLPSLGIQMEVFSGGQDAIGKGDRRTGSTRHDDGGSADVFFYKDGRKLDWANPDDVPIFQEIVKRAKSAGVTGIGAGDGYMQPGSMHVGFGNPGVWGEGGSGANAASWLRSAYNGAPAGASPATNYAGTPANNTLAAQPTQTTEQPTQNVLAKAPQFKLQPYALDEADFMSRRNPLAMRQI